MKDGEVPRISNSRKLLLLLVLKGQEEMKSRELLQRKRLSDRPCASEELSCWQDHCQEDRGQEGEW